jgi:hypothetical protein
MLKIKQESNYLASIVKLGKPIPHPNADRLIGFIINHEIVYTDLTYKEGDVCILFPLGSKINNEFLSFLNAFRDPTKNRDTTIKGYFEDKGRVRAQPLRGEPSNGVIFKVETLEDWLSSKVKGDGTGRIGIISHKTSFEDIIGTEFDSYDDITICEKYIPPVQKEKQGGGSNTQASKKKIEHIVDKQFAFHYDTNHFKKVVEQFQPHDVVSISYKLHGCVSEDTIVDTLEYGKQTIKHIVDNNIVCKIKAYDVYTQEIVYVPIDDYYFKADDGDWYQITLEDGTKLEITSNNPVWLPELQCYRKAEELIIGDKLLKI